MMKHVILLTDAHEAPASTLIEALRGAGITALVEVLREVESAAAVASLKDCDRRSGNNLDAPLAALYEVVNGAAMIELHTVVEHAITFWPGVPLVACRGDSAEHASSDLHALDRASLNRLGFHAIADEPAQLPALLRELEERGTTGEFRALPASEERTLPSSALRLPAHLKARDLRAAFELVASLHFTIDQTSAAHTALAGLATLVPADRWTIYLSSEAGAANQTGLEPLAVRGLTACEHTIPENDWRRSLLTSAITLSGSESKAAQRAASSAETIRKTEDAKRIIAVPLINSERVMGVLEAVREENHARIFSKSEAELLGALAVPIACALANSVRIAEAERLSLTDDLTKLHNARYLRQFLLSEIKRARRYNSSVSALFLDLDDFKRINDVHGHLVGSHVLMEMAAVILSGVRDTDVVARYGGDEFVVILTETGIDQAALVAERIRHEVASHHFTGGRRLHLSLTASFGVAAFPQHAQSPQQLLSCADTAMYEAKAARKNCVRFAAEPQIADHILSVVNEKP